MSRFRIVSSIFAAACLCAAAASARAGTYTVLHAFTGQADGAMPLGSTVRDGAGNLYGLAFNGGAVCTLAGTPNNAGCGTVWKIDAAGTFGVLATFNGTNGALPDRLVLHKGKLYGTTANGGSANAGVIFQLHTDGSQFKLLHDFNGDGCGPGKPAFDAADDLIASAGCSVNNTTEIVKITPRGVFSILYLPPVMGSSPGRVIVDDTTGLIYAKFSDPNCAMGATGCGFIDNVTAAASGTRLTQLTNLSGTQAGTDVSLTALHAGVLYGGPNVPTGNDGSTYGYGAFISYDIVKNTLTVLHAVNPQTDGFATNLPTLAGNDTLYGVSFYGTSGNDGNIYSLTTKGVFTTIYNFVGTNQLVTGSYPESELVWDGKTKTLYGSASLFGPGTDGQGNCTMLGGGTFQYGCGTVFSYTP